MIKKHYPPYFESTPHPTPLPRPINSPTPIFTKKKIYSPPVRSHLKIFISASFPPPPTLFCCPKDKEGMQTMDLYIETNIHTSILFSPLSILRYFYDHSPSLFYFDPSSLWKFRKILPLLILPLTTIKHKRVWHLETYEVSRLSLLTLMV